MLSLESESDLVVRFDLCTKNTKNTVNLKLMKQRDFSTWNLGPTLEDSCDSLFKIMNDYVMICIPLAGQAEKAL